MTVRKVIYCELCKRPMFDHMKKNLGELDIKGIIEAIQDHRSDKISQDTLKSLRDLRRPADNIYIYIYIYIFVDVCREA